MLYAILHLHSDALVDDISIYMCSIYTHIHIPMHINTYSHIYMTRHTLEDNPKYYKDTQTHHFPQVTKWNLKGPQAS